MDMKTDIINYLNQFDLDVRKTKDARFSDQKCTPDVICFIADCIRNSFESCCDSSVDVWFDRVGDHKVWFYLA